MCYCSAVWWSQSWRADPEVVPIADRHYNRQKIGAPQFAPPGACLVLKHGSPVDAFWITSWPYAEYVKHAWSGAWVCSAFRNESEWLSSDLIIAAVAHTLWYFGDPPPPQGMVTFIDKTKVRGKRNFGYCYLKAGFVECGTTAAGLVALQLQPNRMPAVQTPLDVRSQARSELTLRLFTSAVHAL